MKILINSTYKLLYVKLWNVSNYKLNTWHKLAIIFIYIQNFAYKVIIRESIELNYYWKSKT